MHESYGVISLVYPVKAAVPDAANPGELTVQEQIAVNLKGAGDDQEYSFTLPIDDQTPGVKQLEDWMNAGQMVVVSHSSIRATSFEQVAKDEQGNVKKYPRPGKVYTVKGSRSTIEIGALATFVSYGVRVASAEDEQRAKLAHAAYLVADRTRKQKSIADRQRKAEERAKERVEKAKKANADKAKKTL